MQRIRPWHVCALVMLSACADGTTEDAPGDLKAFLTNTTAITPDDGERLNAAFATQAVRAWGYRSAGVQPRDSEAWSPVTSVDGNGATEPGDVSAWVEAGDITDQGVFAPCENHACPEITLSDEQRAMLGSRLNAPGALQTVQRLSGAALRLAGSEADIRWAAGLEVGMVFHDDQHLWEINPRLLDLVRDGAANRVGETLVAPSQNVASSSQNSEEGALPFPTLPEPPTTATPPLRNHEPPPGYRSSSSSDCDCNDCDLIDVKCAVEPIASGHRSHPLLSRPFVLALAALALLSRRRARTCPARQSRGRGWAMRFLPIFAFGLATHPVDAQTPDGASRLAAGKRYLAQKDFASAISELEAARAAGIGRNVLEPLATAYVGASRYPEAYAALGELLSDEALLANTERERVRRQRDALEPKLAFVYVQVEPPAASLSVDGHAATIDPASKLVVVSPGPHHVSAHADGFLDAGQSVATQATRKATVKLSLSPSTAVAAAAPVAPPTPTAAPPTERPATQRFYKFRTGPYVVGHIGFAILTARPYGFHYDTHLNDETKQQQENPGLTSLFGVTAGTRLTRGVGVGGLLMYGRGGGEGTVRQIELTTGGGTLSHEGPADFTQQTIRLGPHFRFMAGGDVARFLAGTSLGAVYAWIDLDHVNVVESGGILLERGTYHHDYSGIDPFWGFDLGAEFNVPSHFLLGFALDVFIERTRGISGNPFGGTAQGYFGFSARVGFHDWKPE
jgi:hypothetical protein